MSYFGISFKKKEKENNYNLQKDLPFRNPHHTWGWNPCASVSLPMSQKQERNVNELG